MAVAVVLLAGASLMVRSFLSVAHIDVGFSREHVLTAQLPLPNGEYADVEKRRRFFAAVVERVRALPGVEAAGAVLVRPLEIELGWDWPHTVEGQGIAEQAANPMANLISCTPGYLEAMGIRLLRGRAFDDRDQENSAPVMIVGLAFALRHWDARCRRQEGQGGTGRVESSVAHDRRSGLRRTLSRAHDREGGRLPSGIWIARGPRSTWPCARAARPLLPRRHCARSSDPSIAAFPSRRFERRRSWSKRSSPSRASTPRFWRRSPRWRCCCRSSASTPF